MENEIFKENFEELNQSKIIMDLAKEVEEKNREINALKQKYNEEIEKLKRLKEIEIETIIKSKDSEIARREKEFMELLNDTQQRL